MPATRVPTSREPAPPPPEAPEEATEELDEPSFPETLDKVLAGAMAEKGFTSLTLVQLAMLDPELAGRDLRITSQTGSGKTVAIGLAIQDLINGRAVGDGRGAKPKAIVVAPTRELAQQVQEELSWLYAPKHAEVVSVTGGADYRVEQRALMRGPAIVVGTPGRLLDHLDRGSIDASQVAAIILDEADRMLDMGFRDELDKIFAHCPKERRTHLVSATFPSDVKALADRAQNNPAHVEGTRLGAANADIDHLIMLVPSPQRVDALVNMLLEDPNAQTLVFARTRADVARITGDLEHAGFAVRSLSGEMQQRERNRAIEAFRSGDLHVLVATDVAARGIDVQDIMRVVHVDPPNDADTYTHRSGRTGRAGRKGTSIVLVPPIAVARTTRLLRMAGVPYKFAKVPSPDAIRAASAERIFNSLTGPDPEGFGGWDDATWQLAKRLAATDNAPRVIARLIARAKSSTAEPRNVTQLELPGERPARSTGGAFGNAGFEQERMPERAPRTQRPGGRNFVPFRVAWGAERGADARRLLAAVCRRGDIRGDDVGSIHIARRHSIVEVAAEVADTFEAAAAKLDERDPQMTIRREAEARPHVPLGADGAKPPRRPPPGAKKRSYEERARTDAESAAPKKAPVEDAPRPRKEAAPERAAERAPERVERRPAARPVHPPPRRR